MITVRLIKATGACLAAEYEPVLYKAIYVMLVMLYSVVSVCSLLFVSSLSCSCKVIEALYVLKTFAVRPGIRELRCLFSMFVCNDKQ